MISHPNHEKFVNFPDSFCQKIPGRPVFHEHISGILFHSGRILICHAGRPPGLRFYLFLRSAHYSAQYRDKFRSITGSSKRRHTGTKRPCLQRSRRLMGQRCTVEASTQCHTPPPQGLSQLLTVPVFHSEREDPRLCPGAKNTCVPGSREIPSPIWRISRSSRAAIRSTPSRRRKRRPSSRPAMPAML